MSLLWISPKRPLTCLREAHDFSWWKIFWNDEDFYTALKSVAFVNRLFDLRFPPHPPPNHLRKSIVSPPGFVLETNKKHLIKLEYDIRIFLVCVHLFIYLALLALNCGTQTIICSMWDLVPWSGIKLAHPLQVCGRLGVLDTRPPGKSLYGTFFCVFKTALPLLFLVSLILHWTTQF